MPDLPFDAGLPLADPPIVPLERPPTTSARNVVIKAAARWLLAAAVKRAFGPIGLFLDAIELGSWIYQDAYPEVQAALDPPKTLEELQAAVAYPRPGYDVHHIVEQMYARHDGLREDLIDGPENLILIPRLKHWQINEWFMKPNPMFGGTTPRYYLRGKDWDVRYKVGEQALIELGVLKP